MNQEFDERALMTSSRQNETENLPITTTEETKAVVEPERNNCRIYALFFVVLFLNLLINFDHGVMPAAAIRMQEDLDLNNMQFGWLGSIVFIGLTLGKLTAQANTAKFIFFTLPVSRFLIGYFHLPEVQSESCLAYSDDMQRFLPVAIHAEQGLPSALHQSILDRLFPSVHQHLLPGLGGLLRQG